MPWVKLDDSLVDDPRVMAAGWPAFGVLVAMLIYSNQKLRDGLLSPGDVDRLVTADEMALVRRLLRVGLLSKVPAGYLIAPDIQAHQPSREQVELQRAQAKVRKERWKERHENTDGTEPERRSTDVRNAGWNGDGTHAPIPVPIPLLGKVRSS
jgi:hypothetical protein